jgi:hypothetical protein
LEVFGDLGGDDLGAGRFSESSRDSSRSQKMSRDALSRETKSSRSVRVLRVKRWLVRKS